MHLCNTKDNHYVPRFYLKSFLDKKLYIHYFDKKTQKYYSTQNLKEIAFKTNLYTITNKINEIDIMLFKELFKLSLSSELEKNFLSWLKAFLNDELKNLFTLEHKKDKEIENKINEVLRNLLNEPDFSRNQELLFTFYENKFQPIYNKIIETEKLSLETCNAEDATISYLAYRTLAFIAKMMAKKMSLITKENKLSDINFSSPVGSDFESDDYLDLVHYLIVQYFRTSKRIDIGRLIEPLANKIKEITGKSATSNNIMFLLIHMQSLNIVDKLIQSKYLLILVKNRTKKPFITSDNPVINVYAKLIENFEIQKFEMFFPITPNLGILYTEDSSSYSNFNKNEMELIVEDENLIEYFNKLIFSEADRHVFGSSLESLSQ